MNSNHNHKAVILRRNKRNNYSYYSMWIVFFFIMWYMAAMCEDNAALDLGRYYYEAIALKSSSVRYIIELKSTRGIDFIYYVILHLGVNSSIPLNIITAFFITLYYAAIVGCIRFFYRGRMEWYVMAAVLFLTPITWVITISRNLAAIAFLYIGLIMFYKNKRLWACLFCIAGIFTHFSVLMYVVLFAASYLLKNLRLKNGTIAVIFIGAVVISFLIPGSLFDIMRYFIEGGETVYATTYVEGGRVLSDFSSWNNIGLGDKASILYSLVFSPFLLINNRKQGLEFWMLFLLTVIMLFFSRSSLMFTNRCMMVMPMFWAINSAQIYKDSSSGTRVTLQNLCLIAIFLIFWHVYSYRDDYFPFFF